MIFPSSLLPAAEAGQWLSSHLDLDSFEARYELARRAWTPEEADAFVAELSEDGLAEFVDGLLPRTDELLSALRGRIGAFPALARALYAQLVADGVALTPAEFALLDDVALAEAARVVAATIDGVAGLQAFLAGLGAERLGAVAWPAGLVRELVAAMRGEGAATPALDGLVRERLVLLLEGDPGDERPRAIETTVAWVDGLAGKMHGRALAVLQALSRDEQARGPAGRPVGARAAHAWDQVRK
jgi:hypothetical protein